MDCNKGLFNLLPWEIMEPILQNLSIRNGYNLGRTCQNFAELILGQDGLNWHKLGEQLQIKKVTIKKIKIKSTLQLFRKKSKKRSRKIHQILSKK